MKKDDLEVYKKIHKSEALKQEIHLLGSLFRHPIWYITSDIPPKNHLRKYILSSYKTHSGVPETKAIGLMIKTLKRARRFKSAQKFEYRPGLYGFALPLAQGGKIYGYIMLCHAGKEVPSPYIELFRLSLDTLIREAQKELELTKLYETIRPRAIALSTIHTIHRLISSTLDIDELLPRIARLSIQVMRANRCSIKLLDKKHKTLIPITTIDLRKNKRIKLKKLPVGKGIPGKAAKRGKAIRGKGYISIPLIDEDIIGVITVYDKTNGRPFTQFDQEILTTLAEQAVIAIKNAQLYQEQKDIVLGSIKSLAMLLNTRASQVYKPSKFMVRVTVEVGRQMGMKEDELKSLEVASMLHDAGQISVPDRILSKPSGLTGEEYALVKEHPEKSAKIIEPLKALKPAIPMILYHHEKYDGSGYPKGLKGDNIPLGARIMVVTEAFEAMVISRPYRQKTKTIEEAVEEIKKYSNTQFDPKVVNTFIKVINKPSIKRFLGEIAYGN